MAKAASKSKKPAAKSKPSTTPRAKEPQVPLGARKATKKAAKATAPVKGKWVYTFGDGKAEGKAALKELLGGKGANLAEMANLGLPVPPGFTISDLGMRVFLCA